MLYKTLLALFGVIALAGCAAKHDLAHGPSIFGGFASEELKPGLHALYATGDFVLSSPRATWVHRADELCGTGQYINISVSRSRTSNGSSVVVIEPGKFVPVDLERTTLSGYVLCKSSPLSQEEAARYIESLPMLRKQELAERASSELNTLGGEDCSTSLPLDSAENLYERGKLLIGQSKYPQAKACFLRSVSYGPASGTYKDACTAIGQMYELGLGGPVDMTTAKAWYAKAGLL